MRGRIINILRKTLFRLLPELLNISKRGVYWDRVSENINKTKLGDNVKIYPPCNIGETKIGDYTYVAQNSLISKTEIGKFCSIGPNLLCGWGIHPMDGFSTHPMFYSTLKQNGIALSSIDKVTERKEIFIGNDVFIGANVTILDGVKIGNGAVIGAGAIVSKDIPDYAIAVGSPIKVIKYRFDELTINKLLDLRWWDLKSDQLKFIEEYFFDIDKMISKLEEIRIKDD